jgi:hypothetical protein
MAPKERPDNESPYLVFPIVEAFSRVMFHKPKLKLGAMALTHYFFPS